MPNTIIIEYAAVSELVATMVKSLRADGWRVYVLADAHPLDEVEVRENLFDAGLMAHRVLLLGPENYPQAKLQAVQRLKLDNGPVCVIDCDERSVRVWRANAISCLRTQ